MPRQRLAAAVLAVGGWILGAATPSLSLSADSVLLRRHTDPTATDQVIVKWRNTGVAAVQIASIAQRTERLRANTGADVQVGHNLYGNTDVLRLPRALTRFQMGPVLAQIEADPGVEYAEPDAWRFIEQATLDAAPNDPHFVAGSDANGEWLGQWYLQPSSTTAPAAIDATTAWKTTTGSASIIVAVIDTGIITTHPDLAAKLLPGYDFVSCDQGNDTTGDTNDCSATGSAATYLIANDGNGWDDDPSDPGDAITAFDITQTTFINDGCTTVQPSSWHGTKVAGIIGAVTNNGIGIAGVAPATMLLPVRAIGVCSGRVSDIAAAITWASGGTVSNIPANPNPANIINLSLGAPQPCSITEQDAVSAAIALNVVVIAAAGNEGGPVDAPANCPNVISVAGLRQTGTKVGYSNLSNAAGTSTSMSTSTSASTTIPAASISIAAPAGNCVNTLATEECLYSIESTSNAGATAPLAEGTDGFYTYALLDPEYLATGGSTENEASVGTSFAAPMASGVAALMLAAAPTLNPQEVLERMQSSAVTFPTSSSTSSTLCTLAATTTDSNGNFTDTSQDLECVCSTATCGAGMLNASAAVTAASGIFCAITVSSTTGSIGQKISLNGSTSTPATGDTIVSYQWSTIPSTSDQIINPNSAVATLVVPSFRSIQVKLTITDSGGHTASATATIASAFGGGSGAFGPELSVLAALAAVAVYRRRRALNQPFSR